MRQFGEDNEKHQLGFKRTHILDFVMALYSIDRLNLMKYTIFEVETAMGYWKKVEGRRYARKSTYEVAVGAWFWSLRIPSSAWVHLGSDSK